MVILLDTNILVRAAISPRGLAKNILDRIGDSDQDVLVTSSHILSEVTDVLSRPRMQSRWPLSADDIQSSCRLLSEVSEDVRTRPLDPVIAVLTGLELLTLLR